mmetsp:Transcript_96433/g.158989  ORF Transcript_96433/g.158989 Transcript_96433/m.158989 type:complete len:81 (+) Transcript_96433:181-423(+)
MLSSRLPFLSSCCVESSNTLKLSCLRHMGLPIHTVICLEPYHVWSQLHLQHLELSEPIVISLESHHAFMGLGTSKPCLFS